MITGPANITRFTDPSWCCGAVDQQISTLGIALPVERVNGNSNGNQIVTILEHSKCFGGQVVAECGGVDRGKRVPRNHAAAFDEVSALGVLVALQRGTILNRSKG